MVPRKPGEPVFNELKSLMVKTSGIADAICEALARFVRRIHAAFIYGSTARGDHDDASDVDVLVAGTVRPASLAPSRRQLDERLGRPVQFVALTAEEPAKLIRERDPFTMNILQQPKIWLVGSETDLATADDKGTRQSRRQATARG